MLKEKVHEYVETIKDAWQKAKGFFGLGGKSTVTVQGANANGGSQANGPVSSIAGPSRVQTLVRQAGAPETGNMGGPQGRFFGAPSHHSTHTSTHTTSITGTQITVVSNDPEKAGQSVKEALQPSHTRTSLRNAQSGVLA
jgi:hypothetical protein